jgi:phosphatidylserine/phosphatidylglycerophosphate/cardiolipin synthase-like enzyme
MFRLLHKRISPDSLLSSKLFDEQSFYKSFINDLKYAEKEVVIESPYLTRKRSIELSNTFRRLSRHGIKIKIYTREPSHHTPRLKQQSIQSIAILKSSGARIYTCRDLRHRKIAIIDNVILWEGSLNILSQSKSRELMRRTVSSVLSRQVLSYTGLNRWYW